MSLPSGYVFYDSKAGRYSRKDLDSGQALSDIRILPDGLESPASDSGMTRTALPSGCSTETRPMERIRLTPTTSRRICKGTSSPSTRRAEPR